MKEQLIEMGFEYAANKVWLKYKLDNGLLWVRFKDGFVTFEDLLGCEAALATNATIEQISNILKSIQI
jgi:hypothetical protein